ncbi:prominin-1 [Patella vulgata]|uniref:prominin-1 n=1 Tax=Patella vulgata TaxID=6465 RepID=UPI00218052F2|nr:prominin-1 [Patella vulgata]
MRIFSLAVVLLLFDQCLAPDPVLTPATLTDTESNTADSNSNIFWSDVPSGKHYKTDAAYDDSGLGPMYDFARSFIGSVLGSFNKNADFIIGIVKKENPLDDPQSVALHFIGFAICLVIGILFMIIFPIIGCCFCCFRCCGQCGGKMMQTQSPSTSCRRIVYSVILLVLIVFTAVGCACVYVTNDQMSTALNTYDDTFGNNVDDISVYLDNTVDQIKRILSTDVNFALDVVKRDLDNTGVLVSVPVRDRFDQQLNVNNLFTQVDNLQTDRTNVVTQFDTVETDVKAFNSTFSSFEGEINSWISSYESTRTACGSCTSFPVESGLTPTIDTTKINTAPIRTEVDKIKDEDLTADVQAARTEFDGIVGKVDTGITDAGVVAVVKNNLVSFQSEIAPIIAEIEKFQSDSAGSLDLSQYKTTVTDYSEQMATYERYKWYAGIGIGSIIALVVVLQLLGLAFGFCGSSASTLPTERGRLSTCGGNMLMASVGFIFIFSSLLMFITTLSFTLGAPMEKFACEPLTQPEKILSLLDAFGVGNPLESVFGKGINITIGDVYRDCGAGKSVYDAFKLDQLSAFDLSAITNYKDTLKIQEEIDNIAVDFSTFDLTPAALTTTLNDFNASITAMDFDTYNAEVRIIYTAEITGRV